MPRVYDLDDDDYFPREQGRKAPRGFPVRSPSESASV